MKDYFEILGISKNANPEMIDYVYSFYMEKYDLEKISDEKEKEHAVKKIEEITEAYNAIKETLKTQTDSQPFIEQKSDKEKEPPHVNKGSSAYLPADLYSYPGEKTSLYISILVMLVVLFGFFAISFGTVIGILIVALIYIRIRQGQLLGNAALVSDNNFKHINDIVDKACKKLHMHRPRAHINQDPYLNAFAIGFSEPFSIVLNSSLIQNLEGKELSFVIGHELGHIKNGHTFWLSAISPFGKTIPGFDFIFGVWQRKAEYTSDRAGLIVCQDLDAAVRSIIKISSGPNALEYTNVDEFLRQANRVDSSQIDKAGELLGTHPYITNRIKALVSFSQSNTFSKSINYKIDDQKEKSLKKICPKCNLTASEDKVFCHKCGTKLIIANFNKIGAFL